MAAPILLIELRNCEAIMLNLYRRDLLNRPQRDKGQNYTKCSCPIWCDGELNGNAIGNR